MFEDENVNSNEPSAMQAAIESPARGQSIYDEAIFVSGWLQAANLDRASCCLRAYVDDRCCAGTKILFPDPEVADRLRFRMLGRIAGLVREPCEVILRVSASWDERPAQMLAEQPVRLVPSQLHSRPYGEVVSPENATVLHRENIYGSGPPIEEAGAEVSNLLSAYLPQGSSVVDVGCGAGAYGPGLMAAGSAWLGLEANAHCCSILERRQLPFRRVDPETGRLPGADGEFDCAICIEVLEHVREPESFLAEIARMIRSRALFSVPNMELLPYLHDWRVVPWHLLEGDHRNFFTRTSFGALLSRFFRRVEIFSYGEHPLRTRDDVPLHVHLFAVADK
jgi:SAM-dependent methyltransferase